MARSAGRTFLVKKNSTTIASIRQKSVNAAFNPIDVTTDDDDGFVTYLADTFATQTMEITVEGVTDSDVLADLAFSVTDSDKHLSDITLERPNGDVISGDFIITAYSETGTHDTGTTFTATLVRNGAHTLTPA